MGGWRKYWKCTERETKKYKGKRGQAGMEDREKWERHLKET